MSSHSGKNQWGLSGASTIAGAGRFTEVKRASTVLLFTIAAVVIALFVWAGAAEVETVTRAEGKVVPSSHMQVVQSLTGGVVEQIRVQAGQTVQQDDLLIILGAAEDEGNLESRKQQLHALKSRAARLMAQIEGQQPQFSQSLRDQAAEYVAQELSTFFQIQQEHQANLSVLDAQVNQRKRELHESEVNRRTALKALEIAGEEREIVAQMVERGLEPKLELVRLDRMIADAEGRAETSIATMERVRSAMDEIHSRKHAVEREFKAKAATELSKTLGEQRALEESLPALANRVQRAELRAPSSGVVNRVLVTTEGGVIKPGEVVVEIVPEGDQLLVEALVQPRDIAFIAVGQAATVKISAYDYAIYGSLKGRVFSISPDTISVGENGAHFFQVKVETESKALESLDRKLPIQPGMQAQVDIITGKKTVLDYLSKPLVGVKENAFRER